MPLQAVTQNKVPGEFVIANGPAIDHLQLRLELLVRTRTMYRSRGSRYPGTGISSSMAQTVASLKRYRKLESISLPDRRRDELSLDEVERMMIWSPSRPSSVRRFGDPVDRYAMRIGPSHRNPVHGQQETAFRSLPTGAPADVWKQPRRFVRDPIIAEQAN